MSKRLLFIALGLVILSSNMVFASPNIEADNFNKSGLEKLKAHDSKGAIADFTRAIKENPKNGDSYGLRGIAKFEIGDKSGGIEDLNKCLKINPKDGDAYYNRGIRRYIYNDKEGGLADINKAEQLGCSAVKKWKSEHLINGELKTETVDKYKVEAISSSIAVGDEFGGGIVFYIDDTGSHGLIVSDTDVRGARTWDEAIAACKNFKKNGYSDWFLPDREQLAALYLRRSVVGGFVDKSAYWSSSQSDIPGCAWIQYFSTGNQYRNLGTNYLFFVRPIRSF